MNESDLMQLAQPSEIRRIADVVVQAHEGPDTSASSTSRAAPAPWTFAQNHTETVQYISHTTPNASAVSHESKP
jgi:hypothetical protein